MRRGQAAVEYVLTYGTSMLIVLGTMSALLMLDPLGFGEGMQVQTCDFDGVIECDEERASFEDGELRLTLENKESTPLRITAMQFSTDGDTNMLEDDLSDGELRIQDHEVEFLNISEVFPSNEEYVEDPLYNYDPLHDEDQLYYPTTIPAPGPQGPGYTQIRAPQYVDGTWYIGNVRRPPRYLCNDESNRRRPLWSTMIHKTQDLEPGQQAPLKYLSEGVPRESPTGEQMEINNLEYVEGIYGSALEFNGEGYATLPEEFLNTKSYTVSFWINIQDEDEEYRTIMTRNNSANERHPAIWVNSGGNTNFHIDHLSENPDDAGSSWQNTNKQLDLDEWYHIAMTVDDTNRELKFYVDGELDYSRTFDANYSDPFPDPKGEILLGDRIGNENQTASGILLDELRLYSEALPQEAINGSGSLSQGAIHDDQHEWGTEGYEANDELSSADETARILMEPYTQSDGVEHREIAACSQGGMKGFTVHEDVIYAANPYTRIEVLDMSEGDISEGPKTGRKAISEAGNVYDIERMGDEWFILDIGADGDRAGGPDGHTESAIHVYDDDFDYNRTIELPSGNPIDIKNGEPWHIWKVDDDYFELPVVNPTNHSQVYVTRMNTDGEVIRTAKYHLPVPARDFRLQGFQYKNSWYFSKGDGWDEFIKMPSLGCEQTQVFGPRSTETFSCDISDYVSSLFSQQERIVVDFRAYNPRVGREYLSEHRGTIVIR